MILRLFVLIAALAIGFTTHAQNDEALTALVQSHVLAALASA